MNINSIKIDMKVKPNFANRNTYKVIGIDKISKEVLIEAINEKRVGITYQQWVSINRVHRVNFFA